MQTARAASKAAPLASLAAQRPALKAEQAADWGFSATLRLLQLGLQFHRFPIPLSFCQASRLLSR
jgi:hypothetical protein